MNCRTCNIPAAPCELVDIRIEPRPGGPVPMGLCLMCLKNERDALAAQVAAMTGSVAEAQAVTEGVLAASAAKTSVLTRLRNHLNTIAPQNFDGLMLVSAKHDVATVQAINDVCDGAGIGWLSPEAAAVKEVALRGAVEEANRAKAEAAATLGELGAQVRQLESDLAASRLTIENLKSKHRGEVTLLTVENQSVVARLAAANAALNEIAIVTGEQAWDTGRMVKAIIALKPVKEIPM